MGSHVPSPLTQCQVWTSSGPRGRDRATRRPAGQALVPGAQSPGTCLSPGPHPAPRPASAVLIPFNFLFLGKPLLSSHPPPSGQATFPDSCFLRALSLSLSGPQMSPHADLLPHRRRLLSRVDFFPVSVTQCCLLSALGCRASPGTGGRLSPDGAWAFRVRCVRERPPSSPCVTPAQTQRGHGHSAEEHSPYPSGSLFLPRRARVGWAMRAVPPPWPQGRWLPALWPSHSGGLARGQARACPRAVVLSKGRDRRTQHDLRPKQ